MGLFNASIHLDLSEPRFFAILGKEGESRKLVFQAKPSEGQFLIPSRFNDPGLAPWTLYDDGLKYVEEGQVHIWEGVSESGHLGCIDYIAPFEYRPRGCFDLQVWVSRETFQFLLDIYSDRMDCRLYFTFAPEGQDVVKSYYDEFTEHRLTAWDTGAEDQILADQVTIQVVGRVLEIHNDDLKEDRLAQEAMVEPPSIHAELISKVIEIKTIGGWIVTLMCAILVVLLFAGR